MLIWILTFTLGFSFADSGVKVLSGYDPATDIIAHNYEAGAYLIYDCREKHWTCVGESFFDDCKAKRISDELNKSDFHSCAPIGVFPTKKSCFQRQLFMVTHQHGSRFCVKEKMKQKMLD